MQLVIDIGNTHSKIAVFESGDILEVKYGRDIIISDVEALKNKYPFINEVIVSAVGKYPEEVKEYLSSHFHFFELTELLPIPISNSYKTPETLGKDRLSAVVAASKLFPNQNNLIIDAGTCITFDFIDKANTYHGGAIIPGIKMRFKALHTFTEKLPLLHNIYEMPINYFIGRTTNESIESGVLNGILFEIEGFIQLYKRNYGALNIILTGGDYKYFEKSLNFEKFANPNLVLIGLNIILLFNVEKTNN